LPHTLTGDRHTARYLADGRIFISFRDTARESPTRGDWVAWVGTWQDIVSGGPRRFRVRLKDNHHAWDCAYPGVERLPDGTILTPPYGHGKPDRPPYTVSIRVHPDALADRLRNLLGASPRLSPRPRHEADHRHRFPHRRR